MLMPWVFFRGLAKVVAPPGPRIWRPAGPDALIVPNALRVAFTWRNCFEQAKVTRCYKYRFPNLKSRLCRKVPTKVS